MIKNAIKVNSLLLSTWLVASSAFAQNSSLLIDMQTLTSAYHQGRKAGSDQPNVSAQYIYYRFQSLGIKTEFQSFEFKSGFFSTALGHNVVALLPCDQTVCGRKIVVTAHYDHLGGTSASFYAGANDNATGTAALLAIAEALMPVSRSADIILLATDAEEKGLYGAKHFVTTIKPEHYALNINLDMLAIDGKNTIYALHDRSSKKLIEQFQKQNHPFSVFATSSQFRLHKKLKNKRINWHKASDHYAFSKKKIPYIYFGMGIDSKHHSKKDTLENMDFAKYQLVVESISDFIVSLARAPLESTN